MNAFFQAFVPKSFVCWREGYSSKTFFDDFKAGLTVGIIALPLAMAFAIGSGVAPERGLYTAIVAGFLISLFGGSRVQIGGPTGAYVVLLYAIVQRHGYEGLALATLLAGVILVCMGLSRLGVLIRYIPHSVITGFTTGIATVIFSAQLKDFFGFAIEKPSSEFFARLAEYWQAIDSIDPITFILSTSTLGIILYFRRLSRKIPGSIIAVIFATVVAYLLDLPVSTIKSTFGEIPSSLPELKLPFFSAGKLYAILPDALAIAFLGAIESLLSCVIADSQTGFRHKSNCELVGQGLANIGSSLFGGIAATGAIARTTANIQMGAKTPMAGIIHALTLLALMGIFAPLAVLMPLGAMAAILIVVAYNMSELEQFIAILKGPKGDKIVLLTTYILTVSVDLTYAVQIGVLLSALFFLKKMSDTTTYKMYQLLEYDDAQVVEIDGPLFFGAANILDQALCEKQLLPKRFILNMKGVPFIDATGLHALKQFEARCHRLGIDLTITHVRPDVEPALSSVDLTPQIAFAKNP